MVMLAQMSRQRKVLKHNLINGIFRCKHCACSISLSHVSLSASPSLWSLSPHQLQYFSFEELPKVFPEDADASGLDWKGHKTGSIFLWKQKKYLFEKHMFDFNITSQAPLSHRM